jgi:hypothetical protein
LGWRTEKRKRKTALEAQISHLVDLIVGTGKDTWAIPIDDQVKFTEGYRSNLCQGETEHLPISTFTGST